MRYYVLHRSPCRRHQLLWCVQRGCKLPVRQSGRRWRIPRRGICLHQGEWYQLESRTVDRASGLGECVRRRQDPSGRCLHEGVTSTTGGSVVRAKSIPAGPLLIDAKQSPRLFAILAREAPTGIISRPGLPQVRLTPQPRWSPAGTAIVFGLQRAGQPDLYTVWPDGTELTQLADTPSVGECWPDWGVVSSTR